MLHQLQPVMLWLGLLWELRNWDLKTNRLLDINPNPCKISALRLFIVHRAEILQIFGVIFWKIDDSINPFWFNLTFSFFNLKWKKNVKKKIWMVKLHFFLETNKSLSPHEIVGIFVPFFAKSNERLYCFIDFLASLWSATNNGRCMT